MSRRNRHLLDSSPLPPLPEIDTTSTIHSSTNHQSFQMSHCSKSQRREPDTFGLSDQAGDNRKPTPNRTVFDDLSSAHSSIVSGKLKCRGCDPPTRNAPADIGSSNPLEDFQWANPHKDFFSGVLLPPHATFTPTNLHESIEDQGFQTISLEERGETAQPSRSPSLLQNIKTTFTTLVSPPSRVTKPLYSFNQLVEQGSHVSGRSYPSIQLAQMEKLKGNHGLPSKLKSDLSVGFSNKAELEVQFGSSVYQSSPPVLNMPPRNGGSLGYRSNPTSSGIPHRNGSCSGIYSAANKIPVFLDDPYSMNQMPSGLSKAADEISIPDGSTVGNIYKHYLHDDALADFSDDGSLSDLIMALPEVKPSSPSEFSSQRGSKDLFPASPGTDGARSMAFAKRLQLQADRTGWGDPPQFSLPTVPRLLPKSRLFAPGSSVGMSQTFSYGDTRNLLDLTQVTGSQNKRNSLTRSESRHDPYSDVGRADMGELSNGGYIRPNPNNPFRKAPKVVIDRGNGDCFIYEGSDFDIEQHQIQRLPLEREVSNALRRASGMSTYSAGSLADSIIDRYRYLGEKTSSVLSQSPDTSDPQVNGGTLLADPAATLANATTKFYNQVAISSSWVRGNEGSMIRVPIHQKRFMFENLPRALGNPILESQHNDAQATITQLATKENDNNDWETVGTRTSAFGGMIDRSLGYGFIGGMIGRTGDSIADTSDGGLDSTFEIDDLRSTQRIAQHPAHSQYQANYCQRNLKDIKVPVFAPRYRVHNVNGFLADSNRLRPQSSIPSYAPPSTLDRAHSNPFQTAPPDFAPRGRKVNSLFLKKTRNPTHFKPSLQTLDTEINEDDYTIEIEPRPAMQKMSEEDRKKKTLEWMKDFDQHKLAVNMENARLNSSDLVKHSRPSSFQNAVENAAKSFSAFLPADNYPSHAANFKLKELKLPAKVQTDGPADARSSCSLPTQQKRACRQDRGDHQATQLRNLTLVQKLQSSKLQTISTLQSDGEFGSHDFSYRSPLAPPKRQSWKILYSPSQLFGFQEAAKADGLDDPQTHKPKSDLSENTQAPSSRKHLFEKPTLRLWKRDEATRTDLTHQKTKCSITVLSLCCIFPPLLLVYIFGGLDGIISWWTKGHYTSYAKGQKRFALLFLVAWSIGVFIGLVVFLVYWFTVLH